MRSSKIIRKFEHFRTLGNRGQELMKKSLSQVILMTKKQSIQTFEERKVRTVWDDECQEWYFSVVDVVAVLTDSVDTLKQYRYSLIFESVTCKTSINNRYAIL